MNAPKKVWLVIETQWQLGFQLQRWIDDDACRLLKNVRTNPNSILNSHLLKNLSRRKPKFYSHSFNLCWRMWAQIQILIPLMHKPKFQPSTPIMICSRIQESEQKSKFQFHTYSSFVQESEQKESKFLISLIQLNTEWNLLIVPNFYVKSA